MSEITESQDEGDEEGCRPAEGNVDEDREVPNLGRVGLVQHDYDDKGCNSAANAIEK